MNIFPLQPHPLRTMVTHYDTGFEVITTINREWAPGDSGPEGRCSRCVNCIARGDRCQMSVGADVPRSEAWDHSPRSLGVVGFESR